MRRGSTALVGMLPDAEVYTLLGMVPCGAGQCYRLSFAPNPGFEPPDMEAEVLQGFAGEVWIDKEQDRLVRLDAHLVRDVNIGFGILGRVDKGGTMALEQAYDERRAGVAADGVEDEPAGRALMVKTVEIRIDEVASGFAPVPEGMGYREGIAMLGAAAGACGMRGGWRFCEPMSQKRDPSTRLRRYGRWRYRIRRSEVRRACAVVCGASISFRS